MKHRTRLFYAGLATFRRVKLARGWGGPYGMVYRGAWWACIECGRKIVGEDDQPDKWLLSQSACARNGHAPCWACGRVLPRLNDGRVREHRWNRCPGKTEADRIVPMPQVVIP